MPQLPNGAHTIRASVTDAAGNETRSDPVTVTTLNGSQPNGRGASRFVKLRAWLRSKRDKPRRSATVPYGTTRFAEGRLLRARYRFQARLSAQPGYPYRAATSRRVSVLVEP